MNRLRRKLPSPGATIACIALVAALVGTAWAAAPVTKKTVKKMIKNGTTANSKALGGKSPASFETAAATDRRDGDAALTGAEVAYLSAQITLPAQKAVTATATGETAGNGGTDDNANCRLAIGGNVGPSQTFNVNAGTLSSSGAIALTYQAVMPAGTHTVEMRCNQGVGSVTTLKERVLTVVATG